MNYHALFRRSLISGTNRYFAGGVESDAASVISSIIS